ncbi:MAG: YerC/YecD family TrpR-related protein, partial [Fischerella sp.]|nr:YerC/YecD family TrpR-related protein [Fischerella sp.]
MSWQTRETTELFKAILKLKTVEEAEKFFRDLCTLQELYEMSKRWQAVRMIDQGLPFREIAEKLEMSTTTVARVA